MTSLARTTVAGLLLLALLGLPGLSTTPAGAQGTRLDGSVDGGTGPLADYDVTLYATAGEADPLVLGTATTAADGSFTIEYAPPADPRAVYYLLARSGDTTPIADVATLASVLGTSPGGPSIVPIVTPITTVGTAYAMAQFTEDGRIAGPDPGLQNAAGMAHNVFDPVTGGLSPVLTTPPNGGETETLPTVNSLANAVAACVADHFACAELASATFPEGGTVAGDSFAALDDLVQWPATRPLAVDAVTNKPPMPYAPARTSPPVAWTVAIRFDGDRDTRGTTMVGPGNFAIDHEGYLWVADNYLPEVDGYSCASPYLLRFTPTGQYAPGSPFSGGGASGVGYGITIDPYGDVWIGNFGFASPGCPDPPPHNSVSQYRGDGTPVSPDSGWVGGGLDWPQGTVSDRDGNIWAANCDGDSVTVVRDGDPTRMEELVGLGVSKPFDVAFDLAGNAYVTGTASDNVAVVAPDGTPLPGSPIDTPGAFRRPMGITSNSAGELWVSNSGTVDLPCPQTKITEIGDPSVAHIAGDGTVTTFRGGGITIPWGISVDGDDNVWVANFGRRRVSAFCGRDDSSTCPPGAKKGDPLSPDTFGFAFDGLERNTATAIDTAGNVWVTNNWLEDIDLAAPGGFEIVAFLGMATPVQPPEPKTRPEPAPAPTPAPARPAAAPPRFTG